MKKIWSQRGTQENLFENPQYLFYNIDQYSNNMLRSYFKPCECPNTAVTKS